MTDTTLPWFRFSLDLATLGLEAQSVVGLRMVKLAAGGSGAEREAFRMVAEKMAAFSEAQLAIFSGVISGAGHMPPVKAMKGYRRRVRANRRRLSRT